MISVPLIQTSPLEGRSSPANKLNRVVFPEPDVPNIAKDSDCLISKLIPFNIVSSVSFNRTIFSRPFASMILRITFFLLILSVFHQTFSQTKNIIVFGDSISAAYGIDSSKGWVNILRERLADNTEDVTIINASVSGETSKGGAARINSVLQKFKPEILILELGGNDGLRGYPISDISSNLETIISTSLSQNTRVVIMGMIIPPNYGIRYSSAFSAIFPKLASKYQLQYVPIQLEGTLTDKTLLQADGIHPNEKGQLVIFEKVYGVLADMI